MSYSARATRIKSGYEALLIKNYFKSQQKFKKAFKYNPSSAAFGLATIYARNDNPFYNIDSAYRYVLLSETSFSLASDKKKLKWAKYGWSKNGIDSLKVVVSSQFYSVAKKKHSVSAYTAFILKHPWSIELSVATDTRDSIAFVQTVNMNNSASYDAFMQKYPASRYAALAKNKFYDSQYTEHTKGDSLELYLSFLDLFPENPRGIDAEKHVFELMTQPNDIASYARFSVNYPNSHLNELGWKQFYQVYLSDYSKARKFDFLKKFPKAKNRKFIQEDFELTDSTFLPCFNNGQYGFFNRFGDTLIAATYDFVGPFNEGLATVMKGDLQGAINKRGELQIPIQYEYLGAFNQGRALIESDGMLGLIDRNNKLILEPVYEDVGDVSEGFIYVQKKEKYQYVDVNGNLVFDLQFDEAFNFNNGCAVVELNEKRGLINAAGEFLITAEYDQLKAIEDTLYIFSKGGKKGVLNSKGELVVSPMYNQIGGFIDGVALATKQDTLVYINRKGELVLNGGYEVFPNYVLKGEFNKGVAIVRKQGKYGRINLNGDLLTAISYENLGVGQTFVPFQEEGQWGVLNALGEVLIRPGYNSIDVYGGNYVVASSENHMGMLDLSGNVLVPFSFNAIEWLIGDYLKVQEGSYYALFKGGEQLTGFDYNQINLVKDDFISLLGDDQLIYITVVNGQWVNKRSTGE
ncbi:MAG: WG repeat-containing protein [Crocinitomicaceae bacterium]|nr:WG repeat-containing protein [Crocinitomicaceae bacterium]